MVRESTLGVINEVGVVRESRCKVGVVKGWVWLERIGKDVVRVRVGSHE